MKKMLLHSVNKVVHHQFLGLNEYADLVISGRVYVRWRKFLWFKPKLEFFYTLSVPYIQDPFYDGQYNTNRILRIHGEMVKQELIDKVQEYKEKYYGKKNDNNQDTHW